MSLHTESPYAALLRSRFEQWAAERGYPVERYPEAINEYLSPRTRSVFQAYAAGYKDSSSTSGV